MQIVTKKTPAHRLPAGKKPLSAAPKNTRARTAVIGGVEVKLATPEKPAKRAAEIRAAVKAYYAARRA